MKMELGDVSTQMFVDLSVSLLGTTQVVSQTPTTQKSTIPVFGSSMFKSIEATATGSGFGSAFETWTSATLTLVTKADARILFYAFSETSVSAANGNALGVGAGNMMAGITPTSTYLSQFLSGNDTITGNIFANQLSGGAGNDRLIGSGGADAIDGGSGTDTAVYRESAHGDYLASRRSDGSLSVATRDGTTDKLQNIESLEFTDGTVAAANVSYLPGFTSVPSTAVNAVYRFYNARDKAFFYTKTVAERDMIIRESTDPSYTPENGLWPYFYQGTTFEEAHSSAGSVPVFRFYNTKTGHHFFTTSVSERDMVQRESTDPNYGAPGLWTFVYEGEAFRAFADSRHADAAPVYRFYSPSQDRHFFTGSADEAAQIRLTGQWTDEGIGYWGEVPG